MENNEREWLQQFKDDMEKLDDSFEPYIPSQHHLMNTLQEYKIERKRAFRREFLYFLVTAIFILTSYITIAFKLTPLFLLIQGIVILALPIIIVAEKKRRQKEDEVNEYGF